MAHLSQELPEPLAHDHLDELESFFYVLSRIIHAYDCHGVYHSLAGDLNIWEKYSDDQSTLAICKQAFLVGVTVPRVVSGRWPDACLQVFHAFRAFVKCYVHKKFSIIYERPEDGAEILKSLWLGYEDHYNHVLGLFDDGIAALQKADAEKLGALPPPPLITTPMSPSMERTSLKRPSNDYPDTQPPAKRAIPPQIIRSPRSPPSPTSRTGPRGARLEIQFS